jgi:hypothetical protein
MLPVCFVLLALGCWVDAQVRFPTNIPEGDLNTLTDAEKAEGWELLFNGSDLAGWETDARGAWRIEKGILVSTDGPSHLFTLEMFADVEVSWYVCAYDIAVPKQRFGNSGVFLRTVKTDGNYPRGYEVQVDPYDIKNPTGGIYGMAPGSLLVDGSGSWKPEAFLQVHEGKWIHQRARIKGNRIEIWINGEKTLDWTDPENRFPEPGPIALQNHHKSDVVLFANIKARNLK